MRRLALLSSALLLLAAALGAQTSSHSRLGIERKDRIGVSTSIELEVSEADTSAAQGLALAPSLSVELLYDESWRLSLSIPCVAWLDLGRDALPRATAALGDPSASAGYTFRSGDWRLGASTFYRCPLGVWYSYEAAAREIVSGSGYHRVGLDLAATRFLDPLILSALFEISTGLPRAQPFGYSFLPLASRLSLGATEALSDVVALSLGLDQGLAAPTVENGVISASGASYSLSADAALLLSADTDLLKIGFSKSLSSPIDPASFVLTYTHIFRFGGDSK